MSLVNLPEDFLYERLPAGLIALDERALIQAVVGGYQDRLEDLRAYGGKFQLFFSPVGLPEAGPNVVFVDFTTDQGRVVTRSLEITTTTPTTPDALLAWTAEQLGVDESRLANPRLGLDLLRFVDANILDYLATNLGAVLYRSAVADQQPIVITDSGTFTATQVAHQKLIETYFPRLKFKGTARSFDALGKLLGFDDVRMVPLWSRVSPRLPNDPGTPANDVDYREVPEYFPQQELDPFYDPLQQRDGPYFHWYGTVANGTAATNYYPQVINGYQPWVMFVEDAHGISNGTLVHAPSGTYMLDGGAAHFKASASIPSTGTFYAVGEGESWNGIDVEVTDLGGTLRRLDITDRLSAIKYRSSFYNLGITMDTDKAEELFGTLAVRSNKNIAAPPHPYVSFSGTLYGTSPFRPFVSGTASFQNTTGVQTSDFLTPFSGTVLAYVERHEATLSDAQENFNDLAKAGQGVTQALEEVRAATRFPRRASYGYLQDDTVQYAPITAEECILTADPSTTVTATGTFHHAPLPPYRTGMTVYLGTVAYQTDDTTDSRWPQRILHELVVPDGTLAAFTVPSAGSYSATLTNNSASTGTVCVDFYGTIGENNYPDTHEVVRMDAFIGTQVFATLGDYGLASHFGAGQPAQAVADEIHSWNPEIILTVGDNNYYSGSPATIAANNAGYLADIQQGRMFPTLGNHDLDTDNGVTQATFFFNGTVPGPANGRYYNVRRGNVEFFIINSGWNNSIIGGARGNALYTPTLEPDGNTFTSVQGQWLRSALRRSTAPWKLVYVHEPPYCSQTNTSNYSPGYPRLRWPFREWGATAVLSGHVHAYERLLVDDLTYIITGIGGENNRLFTGFVSPGSVIRYSASSTDYGATKITATESFIRFDTITIHGVVVDSYQIDALDRRYMPRPEDELDDDQQWETLDEYPYRRDILGGGELVETDFITTSGTNFAQYSILEQTMAVKDQTEVDFDVYVAFSQFPVPQFVIRHRPLPYKPGQRAVCFQAQFRDQSRLTVEDTDPFPLPGGRTQYYHSELDNIFQPGYQLYHAGLVNGVLVADADKFNGSHHLSNLVGWLPLNEHPEGPLTVRDAVMSLASQSLNGVAPQDRLWDSNQGFSLRVLPGAQLASSAFRDCGDYVTISFWIKLPPGASGLFNNERILTFGNVNATLLNSLGNNVILFGADSPFGTQWAATGWTVNDWAFVYVKKDKDVIYTGFGSLTTPATEAIDVGPHGFIPNAGNDLLLFQGASLPYQVRDVRIWNCVKTPEEMELVRQHQPQATQVPYRVGHVLSLNTGDRYGLKVLPTGWLAPTEMPAWVRTPKYAKIVRYDSAGEYEGEAYRRELGLGGGRVLPTPWKLGEQYYSLTADGTVVVSPQDGAMPGSNEVWRTDTAPGNYVVLSGAATPSGVVATVTSSGSGGNPWPNRMEATNPIRDSIWLENGTRLYEAKLQAGGIGTNNIVATFSGLVWAMPVVNPSGASTQPADQVVVPTGDGVFTVTLRIRGVVETKDYSTASPVPTPIPGTGGRAAIYTGPLHAYTDGYAVFHPAPDGMIIPSHTFNEYLIIVSNPSRVYIFNASPADSAGVLIVDYTVDIQVAGGATVTLRARDEEGQSHPNLVPLSIVPGIGDPPLVLSQPYPGQFMQMDVVAITGGSSSTTFTTATFVTTSVYESNQQQGDTATFLATPGYRLAIDASGSVVQEAYSGTVTTPPLYMYLHETLLEDAAGAETFNRWTDPSSFGIRNGVPSLPELGQLSFTNNSTLRAGTYRLEVDLGNLGRVDDDFDGFRLDITVADTTFNKTMLAGYKGSNFRGLDELDFTLDHDIVGGWILTFDWLNSFRNPARGQARQLAIYGYRLRRLETNVYEVTLPGSGTLPAVTQLPYSYGTAPGGWLAEVNSYGTASIMAHEGTVYPVNDTVRSRYPLANLLTGVTDERREDVIATGTFCLPDVDDPPVILITLPSLTGLVSDSATLAPVAGAAVSFTDSNGLTHLTTSNALGIYLFEDIVIGPSSLTGNAGGYISTTLTPTIVTGVNTVNIVLVP